MTPYEYGKLTLLWGPDGYSNEVYSGHLNGGEIASKVSNIQPGHQMHFQYFTHGRRGDAIKVTMPIPLEEWLKFWKKDDSV